jgi:hypothetical protein
LPPPYANVSKLFTHQINRRYKIYRNIFWKSFLINILSLAFFVGFYILCEKLAGYKIGKEDYTGRHQKYNLLFFEICLYVTTFNLLTELFYRNLGFRTRFCCINYTWCLIFILIRLSILLYFIYILYPKIRDLIIITCTINKDNYWKDKSDPFITNDSTFNAVVCWIIWIIIITALGLIIFYTPFLLFGIIITLFRCDFKSLKLSLNIIRNVFIVSFTCYLLGNPAEAFFISNNIRENLRQENKR